MAPLPKQRLPLKTESALLFLLLLVSCFVTVTHGWIARGTPQQQQLFSGTSLQVGSSAEPNPCWQDMYDEDCAMETIFAAQYIASAWIKKLPCAKGLEDCDFPEDVNVPEIRPESHQVEINVMEFLNIKRAKSVKEGSSKE